MNDSEFAPTGQNTLPPLENGPTKCTKVEERHSGWLLGRVLFRGYSQDIEIARSGATPAQLEWLPSVVIQIRAWYNPKFRYAHFAMISMTAISLVLLGMILAFPMAFLSGTVVRVLLDCGMFHRRREESKRLNTVDQPMVIISASGMASDYKTSC